MRRRFILYKINEVPGGGSSISYLKTFKYKKPVFTILKSEARRFGLIQALFLGLRYSLSTLPERLAWKLLILWRRDFAICLYRTNESLNHSIPKSEIRNKKNCWFCDSAILWFAFTGTKRNPKITQSRNHSITKSFNHKISNKKHRSLSAGVFYW